jgi:NDP-sugar pyrophosphorylase family protein
MKKTDSIREIIQGNVQCVIFNGGRGYRLSAITNGRIPKGYLLFDDLPLISFQINSLYKIGIRDFIIIVSTEDDERILREYISKKIIPALDYNVLVIEYIRENCYSSPYLYFKNNLFLDQIGGKSLLTINSDNIFRSEDVKGLIENGLIKTSSVVSIYNKPACKNPFLIENNRVIKRTKNMFVDDSDITGVTFYTKDDVNILGDKLHIVEPHVHKAIEILLGYGKKVFAEELSYFINMNTFDEYNMVAEYISLNPEW